jgi:tetratricopeptide (TPR) repeat protein
MNSRFHAKQDSGLKAAAYFEWGMSLWSQGKMADAETQFARSLHWAREAGNEQIEAESLEFLSATGMFSGMSTDKMLDYLGECLAIYERIRYWSGVANVHQKMSYVLVSQGTGRYEAARRHVEKGLAICRELGERDLETHLRRSLGAIAILEANYREAFDFLCQAHAISRDAKRTFAQGVVVNHLGYLRYNIGDLEQAKELQEESLRLFQSIDNRQRMGKSWSALSQIHRSLGDLDQAVEYAERSVQLGREMGEAREEAQALVCLAYAQIEQGRLADARAAFERAYDLRRHLGQANRSMEPLAGLAYLALLQADAEQLRERVEPIFAHIRSHAMDFVEDTFQVYWIVYRAWNALEDARAVEAAQIAHQHLVQRAATLTPDEERIFWNVPGHREIAQAVNMHKNSQTVTRRQ